LSHNAWTGTKIWLRCVSSERKQNLKRTVIDVKDRLLKRKKTYVQRVKNEKVGYDDDNRRNAIIY